MGSFGGPGSRHNIYKSEVKSRDLVWFRELPARGPYDNAACPSYRPLSIQLWFAAPL
jgi:hypothetical protein